MGAGIGIIRGWCFVFVLCQYFGRSDVAIVAEERTLSHPPTCMRIGFTRGNVQLHVLVVIVADVIIAHR